MRLWGWSTPIWFIVDTRCVKKQYQKNQITSLFLITCEDIKICDKRYLNMLLTLWAAGVVLFSPLAKHSITLSFFSDIVTIFLAHHFYIYLTCFKPLKTLIGVFLCVWGCIDRKGKFPKKVNFAEICINPTSNPRFSIKKTTLMIQI